MPYDDDDDDAMSVISARNVFVRTNRRDCHDVRPSGTGVHCDHTVHVSAVLNLCLSFDIPMFWAP